MQPNPHTYFDPLIMMGVVGAQTTRIKVGVVRHRPDPPEPGDGRGVRADAGPRHEGPRDHRPRLRGEAQRHPVRDVVREAGRPAGRGHRRDAAAVGGRRPGDFDGRFHTLDHAVLGLRPYGERPPEIWTAAHGPRMLALTGAKADGWLPTKMSAPDYGKALTTIDQSAHGRRARPGGDHPGDARLRADGPGRGDRPTAHRSAARTGAVRAAAVAGVPRPGGRAAAGCRVGFHDFIPSTVPRAESLRIIDAIPPAVVRHYAFGGTPAQVAEELAEYRANGLRHLVMWNITAFGDPRWPGGPGHQRPRRSACPSARRARSVRVCG